MWSNPDNELLGLLGADVLYLLGLWLKVMWAIWPHKIKIRTRWVALLCDLTCRSDSEPNFIRAST
jgi:hypothetical protein